MALQNWPPRVLAIGCVLLVVAVLLNNATLAADPYPARSWGAPEDRSGSTVLGVTFQLEEGDRLTIDIGRSLFHLDLDPRMAGVVVTLSPSGASSEAARAPIRSYVGDYVNEPPRGLFFRPEPPTWSVEAPGWLTYRVELFHGAFEPPAGEAGALWAKALNERLVHGGTMGPSASPYQVIPASSLAAQPVFYAVQGLAVVAIVAGAVVSLRSRQGSATGLEAGLRFADQARQWLARLHGLLWLTGVALGGLALTVFLLVSGSVFNLHPGLYPDPMYMWWMIATLTMAFAAGITGVLVMLVRVRRAMSAIPELDVDA